MPRKDLLSLLNEGCITDSDRVLLPLLEKNQNLTLLQSKDIFDWDEIAGQAEYLLGNRWLDYSALKRFDSFLDLSLLNENTIYNAGEFYNVKSILKNSVNESSKDRAPNLKYLGLVLKAGGNSTMSSVNLSKYKLSKTERYIEYPHASNPVSQLACVKTVVCTLRRKDPGKNNEIKLIYRMSISGNEVVGSRLYIGKSDGSRLLDKKINNRVVSMMKAIDYWHDKFLNESDSTVQVIGHERKPDYFSLYG